MAVPARSIVPYAQFEVLGEARSIIEQEAKALQSLTAKLNEDFCDAVDAIGRMSGRLMVLGMGKAGLIGQKLAATFSSTGTPAYFVHPGEAIHGDLGCLQPGDVAIVLSNSGETEEVSRLLPLIQNFDIPIIAITASNMNTLSRQATYVLEIGRLPEAGLHGLPPTTSTTAMLAMGDALALCVARQKNFGPENFATFHPGGSLGRKLTPVTEIMRSGDELRIAHDRESIRSVISHNNTKARRTGAVILVDDQGCLSGLFTDSDLVRLLEKRSENLLDGPIQDVMTKSPRTISESALVSDVLGLLRQTKLSEIPVVDAEDRPVGLVDITDIVALFPSALE